MILVTGFDVSSLILASTGAPHPGFLVSTTVTPFDWMKTAVLPPLSLAGSAVLRMNRLSRSFSTVSCPGAGPCAAARRTRTEMDNAPNAITAPRTTALLMLSIDFARMVAPARTSRTGPSTQPGPGVLHHGD